MVTKIAAITAAIHFSRPSILDNADWEAVIAATSHDTPK
jgi:hypothetical protein